ncbi:MAG: hypothetical protein HY902_05335 [Deltaproteobacteria bacterium]|nr:hypothetical protein [Deltaproteobacteria bacterium]
MSPPFWVAAALLASAAAVDARLIWAAPRCDKGATMLSCQIDGDDRLFNLAASQHYLSDKRYWTAARLRSRCQVISATPPGCDWIASLGAAGRTGVSKPEAQAERTVPPPKSVAKPGLRDAPVQAKPVATGKGKPAKLPKGMAKYAPAHFPTPSPKTWASKDCAWREGDVDTTKLAAAMKARNFKPPQHFRAFVAVIDLKGDGIASLRGFDYDGHGDDPGGWNPASTVKLFTAAGAIEFARAQGFATAPLVRMKYPRGEVEFSLSQLVWAAIWKSDNIAHDRLAQIAGFDELHGPAGMLARAGLQNSAVMRAYMGSQWEAEGHDRSLRDSPAMQLRAGKRIVDVPARPGTAKTSCGGAACTSLQELSKMMCTVMLHEQLPPRRRLALGTGKDAAMLRHLREALRAKRDKGPDPVWEALVAQFPGKGSGDTATYPLWRKGGFSEDWISDNFFIRGKGGRRYLLAMSAYGGRGALTGAANVLAPILRRDELTAKKKAPPAKKSPPAAKPKAIRP